MENGANAAAKRQPSRVLGVADPRERIGNVRG
jgi:hypothetical protein